MDQIPETNENVPYVEIEGLRKDIEGLKDATEQLVHRLRNRRDECLMDFLEEGDIETLASIAITLGTLDTKSAAGTAPLDRSIEDLMRVCDSIEIRGRRGASEDLESLLGLKRDTEALIEVASRLEHTFGQNRRTAGQTNSTESLAARLKEVVARKSWYLNQRADALAAYLN